MEEKSQNTQIFQELMEREEFQAMQATITNGCEHRAFNPHPITGRHSHHTQHQSRNDQHTPEDY